MPHKQRIQREPPLASRSLTACGLVLRRRHEAGRRQRSARRARNADPAADVSECAGEHPAAPADRIVRARADWSAARGHRAPLLPPVRGSARCGAGGSGSQLTGDPKATCSEVIVRCSVRDKDCWN